MIVAFERHEIASLPRNDGSRRMRTNSIYCLKTHGASGAHGGQLFAHCPGYLYQRRSEMFVFAGEQGACVEHDGIPLMRAMTGGS